MKNSHKAIGISLFILFYNIIFSIIFIDKIINYYNTFVNPLFWIITILLSFVILGKPQSRIKGKTDKLQLIFIIVLTYIILYFISGLFFGYAKSPYSHSVFGILKNFWAFLLVAVLREIIRYLLVNNVGKNKTSLIIIIFIFVFSELNFYSFSSNFINNETIFKYISTTLIPAIFKNFLLVYLNKIGPFFSSIIYVAPIIFVNLLVPIFPNINWFLESILELSLIVITFIILYYEHVKKSHRESKRRIQKEHPYKNIILIMLSLLFVGFVANLFKYKPTSIMSGSMHPIIKKGDVVIVEKLNKKSLTDLKIGDIIEFQQSGTLIIHRIANIIEYNNVKNYITKGDANEHNDINPVYMDNINGVVRFKIPYLGYPALILNEFFQNNSQEEF